MNFISLSPHFPPGYYRFSVQLRRLGVNVLGLADEASDNLQPELKTVLTEYFRVRDMHNYDELLRALGFFTYKYGKIDRLESHNEYWLDTEARLRTDFNIPGIHAAEIARCKRKSLMKEIFRQAGLDIARGQMYQSQEQARAFIKEVGLPVVVKPDSGVGANATYRINSLEELENFTRTRPQVDYFMEEFIRGSIESFDGLANQDGRLVFTTSHVFEPGIMEIVNNDLDIMYYSQRVIPPDVEAAGMKMFNAYQVRERFFHFEFFRTPQNQLVALEVNMRPPGGWTTDMWNYANDLDIYQQYANVVVNNRFDAEVTRPYFCAFVGLKHGKPYLHLHPEILSRFGRQIVYHGPVSSVFQRAMGDYGYIVRTPDLGEMKDVTGYIMEKS